GIAAQIKKTTDPVAKRNLEREQFEAELARGINQFELAETYVKPNTAEVKERDAALVAAEGIFQALGKGRLNTKTAWVGRAWMGECEFGRGRPKEGGEEFDRILKATTAAADDGKRMVRFFQLRRTFLGALGDQINLAQLREAEKLARAWLATSGYDSRGKP